MGMMDKAKDMMGSNDTDLDNMDRDSMMARYQELRRKDENNELDDNGRNMMSKLRDRLGM